MTALPTSLLAFALLGPAHADDPHAAPTVTETVEPAKDRRRGLLRRRIARKLGFWAVSPHGQRPDRQAPLNAKEAARTRQPGERGCGL